MPIPNPPAISIMIVSVIGTLAGGQFGLFGGQGLGPPFPGWVNAVVEAPRKNNINNTE